MPLISIVGRKALSVRALLIGLYIILTVGAMTMLYPFGLMFSMATAGSADFQEVRLVPKYWYSDLALFKKQIVDAVPMSELAVWFHKDEWLAPLDIRLSQLQGIADLDPAHREALAKDWWRFIYEACPAELKLSAFNAGYPLKTYARDGAFSLWHEYMQWLEGRYETIDAVNKAYTDTAVEWKELGMPAEDEQLDRQPQDHPRSKDWRLFIETREPHRTGLININAKVLEFLVGRFGNADNLAEQTGWKSEKLTAVTYDDLHRGELGADAKRLFIQQFAPMRYVRIDVGKAAVAWRDFLKAKSKNNDQPLTERMPLNPAQAGVWSLFVQKACPLQALDVARPETYWWDFLREQYRSVSSLNAAHGTQYEDFSDSSIGRAQAVSHYHRVWEQRSSIRWRYLVSNFVAVFKFVAVHGSALKVTVLYIILLIGATLTINPLAAYALSRFRLKESHHVLIFLLATMAFPGEVLMIPSFLMIKSFPITQFLAVGLCVAGFIFLRLRFKSKIPLVPGFLAAMVVTGFLVGWFLPKLGRQFDIPMDMNLLNTYWALVLPVLANGYGIFLLKGFFDSLPPELYEAGLIDGASEMRMFAQITFPLCKPIMAVMALAAFTAAYGAFMHAFLVCQDPKMWTLMVFLYEFQQNHSLPLVMSSLVVAAVPTLIVFVLCQRVILRGIVIPTFK